MANIDKLVCTWTGIVGPPGYTVFYFSASQGPAMQSKVGTFWQSVASYIPTGINITVPNSGATLDDAEGEMVNSWTGGLVFQVPGTASSSYSSVSGALIRWDTGIFKRGRKVVGRTFIVPIYSSAYGTNGIILPSVANGIRAAADALKSTPGQLVIWHRPLYDRKVDPPVLKEPGSSHPVIGTAVPSKCVYLSSRRD